MNVMLKGNANWGRRKRSFEELSDAEILAVAISNEEEAARAYTGLRGILCSLVR